MKSFAPVLLAALCLLLARDAPAREDTRKRREKRIARLYELIASERPTYRAKGAEMLGRLGAAESVEKLIALLQDEHENVRAAAAGALGKLCAKDAIDPLIELLADPKPEPLLAAVTALGEIGHVRAVKPIAAKLIDDPRRFMPIAIALGRIGDKAGLPALKRIYDAVSTPGDKCDVAAAIGKVQPALGLELIAKHAKEREPASLFAALHAAGEMSCVPSARWLLEQFQRIESLRDVASEELLRDAFAAAIGALRDEKLLRIFVAEATRERKDPAGKKRASYDLITVLRGVAQAAHPKMYPDVYPFARDPEQEVMLAAISALGRIGDARATDLLTADLDAGDPIVVTTAAEALGNLGLDAAIDPLLAKLEAPDLRVRFAAAKALAQLRPDDIVEPLIRCLENATDWLGKEIAAILKDVTNMDLLTAAEGWRAWWEKSKKEFQIMYEEDHVR